MNRLKIIFCTILATLFVVSVIRHSSYEMFKVDVLIYWTFRVISFSAVVCILWALVGVFIKNVRIKVVTLLLMVTICIGIHVLLNRPNKVVYQKENILYIKPMPKNDIK